ncbi:uncharacterized protein PY1_contig-18-13 [Novosphingobium sp. PY1]|nr:uncharacterized protein PY1_contig-18-13 [Novosphingobium sp. PY1]
MERQFELLKPSTHRIKEATSVVIPLEADHNVISISHDEHVAGGFELSPTLDPQVEHVVQVNVTEQRRDLRTLPSPPVIHSYDPVFEDARSQPFLDQADDAFVADPVFQEANQPFLADSPKEILDIGVNNPVHLPLVDRYTQRVQRIMRSSSGPEPVGEATEVAFVDGVEHHDGRTLDDLFLQSGNRQRPLLSICLRYIRPARWLRAVRSPLDPFV